MKPSEPKRILIVEDDLSIREGLADLLEGEGYRVTSAENGKVGLERLIGSRFDLIILDLAMPVLDGYGFRERQEMLPEYSGIPVVVMTADGHIEEKKFKIGAKGGIRKPFEVSQVLSLVQRLLQ